MKKKVMFLVNHEVVIYNFRKELVLQLMQEGYEVIICVPKGPKVQILEDLGCKIIHQNFDRRGKNPFKDFKIILNYFKIIKEYKPDIVLSYTIKPNIYGGIVTRLLKVPLLTTITGLGSSIHNKSIFEKLFLILYRTSLKKSYTVFIQNQKDLKFFLNNGFNQKKLELTVGSGVNLQEFKLQKYPDHQVDLRVLFIGRVMKEKGIYELLEAARYFKGKNIVFDVVGFFDDGFFVESDYKYENVNFLGEISNVKGLIKNAHVIILPSYHEGMSNALLESAASGRPLLATNIHGCKEIIDDGVNGYLFEPKSSESIISAIKKFHKTSYEQKVNMGLNSRGKMEKEFDRKIVVDTYFNKIQEAIK